MNTTPTPRVIGLLAGILSLLAGLGIVWVVDRNDVQRAKASALTEVADQASRVQTTINTALSSTYALGALVRQDGGAIADFDATAAQLLPFYPGVASLQTAPQGVVQQVYPLEGNEKAIGHDLLADSARTKEAFLARDTGRLTLAGPFDLIQGGVGAVGRLPIFLKNAKGEEGKFWGFTSALIRFPQVLQDAHFDKLTKLGYQYSLWRVHPDSLKTQVIASSLPADTQMTDAVAYPLDMPNGKWTLSVSPTNGWRNVERTSIYVLLATFVSILIGWLARQMGELRLHRRTLASQVEAQTQQLRSEVEHNRVTSAQLQKLSLAVEQSPSSVVITDIDGRIEYVNEAFVRKTGYSRDELIGQNPRLLQSGRTPPENYRSLWNDLSHGRVWTGEFCNRTKAGIEYTEWATVAPIKQSDGRISHFVAVKEDITDKKRMTAELDAYRLRLEELVRQRTQELEETEARATLILESSADGLYGVNRGGVITFINPAACSLLGYSSKEAIGQIAHNLFHHSWPDGTPYPLDCCSDHRAISSGQELRRDDETYWHADGHPVPVMIAIHPMVQNGEVTGAVISVVDITVQRAAAAAREEAIRAAENLARAKSEFLANMSHEIRTPLNAITGMTHILRRSGLSDQQADRVGKIETASMHLLDIVNAVLDMSKIEAGKFQLEEDEIDIDDMVASIVNIVSENVKTKGLKLVVELPPMPDGLLGDNTRLRQALLNYVSNAIKFTQQGSITISARLDEETLDDALIRFSVTDTGIGIDPNAMARLFTYFEQGDKSTTRQYGGTGLGLAITRQIAQVMGGDAGVRSQEGKGSTFWFSVRLRKRQPQSKMIPAQAHTDAESTILAEYAGARILLAEDVPINREIVQYLLEDVLLIVDMAEDGKQALDLATKNDYALILMDMQMPNMDGLEATRQIRQHTDGKRTPIVAMTANSFSEDKARCTEAGMDDYLSKPVSPDALYGMILRWLEKQQ